MIATAIAWLLGPFLAAFITALSPRLGRPLTLLASAATVAMAAAIPVGWAPESLQLLGPLGVRLQLDALAAPFLLLNGLVTAAVALDGFSAGADPDGGAPSGRQDSHLALLMLVLLGAVNSAIVAVDLISIYVALEVVGVAVVVLLALGNGERDLWLGLRYGLLSNTVMLLFLIGAGLVYLQQGTFALAATPLAGGAPGVAGGGPGEQRGTVPRRAVAATHQRPGAAGGVGPAFGRRDQRRSGATAAAGGAHAAPDAGPPGAGDPQRRSRGGLRPG